MARKTNGNTTTRKKKGAADATPATMEMTPEVRKEGPKKRKAANQVIPTIVPLNLEEEIRRRAYELYLQRSTASGGMQGDEGQDWLIAEREVLSRQSSQEQRSV